MKEYAIRALLVTAAVVGLAAQAARAQVNVDVSIGGFYDELAPYGRWVECSYGQCWVPAQVATDWQPYSNGQWIYTEYGWTWVSNDPWGGNPYHYGTWASIPGYGWSWVPGTVWAPAWVTWSYSNNYVGWAPLPPTVVFGASGYVGAPIVVTQTQYVFVPTNRFVGRNVATVRIPAQQSAQIFQQTKPVTGFAVSGGIVRNTALPMETIERASGGKIETRGIQTAGTAPHAVSSGTARLAVVAPAREVRAAAAARPQTIPPSTRSAQSEKHAGAPVPHNAESASAAKGPAAPPMESHRQVAEAPAEQHRQQPQVQEQKPRQADASQQAQHVSKPSPQPGREQPAERSQHQAAAVPVEPRPPQPPPHQGEPKQQAKHAPKPTPHTGKEKPAEPDKKPDGAEP